MISGAPGLLLQRVRHVHLARGATDKNAHRGSGTNLARRRHGRQAMLHPPVGLLILVSSVLGTTCTNRLESLFRRNARKARIVRCAGKLRAASTRNATSSCSLRAIIYEQNTPMP